MGTDAAAEAVARGSSLAEHDLNGGGSMASRTRASKNKKKWATSQKPALRAFSLLREFARASSGSAVILQRERVYFLFVVVVHSAKMI